MIDHESKIDYRKLLHFLGNMVFLLITALIVFMMVIAVKSRIEGNVPSIFGYKLYYVSSGSMTPTIPVGSIIIVKEIPITYIKEPDVITYRGSSGSVVTHRVIKASEDGKNFTTRGDANDSNDPLPVKAGDIIGKVILHISLIGYLIKLFQSYYGVLIIIATIVLKFCIDQVLKKKAHTNLKL